MLDELPLTRLAVVCHCMIVQETKVDAPDPEAEFAKLFEPYAADSGVTEEEIDVELDETKQSLDKFRNELSGKKVLLIANMRYF